MEDDPIDFENSHPDMEKIIESDKLLPVTKSVAKMLMRNPYTSLGRFFKKLSNENLEMVGDFFMKLKDYFEKIFVISHNPLISNWADNVVRINKTDNISKVSQ